MALLGASQALIEASMYPFVFLRLLLRRHLAKQQAIMIICCFALLADPCVALLGASQALFEASMYTFVFLWTPSLSPNGEKLPHGYIFAIFMTASMVGTALAGKLIKMYKLELIMQVKARIQSITKQLIHVVGSEQLEQLTCVHSASLSKNSRWSV